MAPPPDAFAHFSWDLANDAARLTLSSDASEVWRGSLLPLFWLATAAGDPVAVKARVQPAAALGADGNGQLALDLPGFGTGVLTVERGEHQLRFTSLEVTWEVAPSPRIIAWYWGCDLLTEEQRADVPHLERPFWPNWQAWGFAVPSAKTSPMQSFFRRWDFGHADVALGSFGPAMGTPYAAAFPRPLLAAGLGNDRAILCAGAGALPDAALTLQIRSSSGCLEWRAREDLWGAPPGQKRRWEHPLRLVWDRDAWSAYQRYFRGLTAPAPGGRGEHAFTFMGTWGDFRRQHFDIPAIVDRAVDGVGGDVLCIDDSWESFAGSGEPHPERFPRLEEDLAYARRRGLRVGIWQSCGWIADYRRVGLTADDVMLNRDGRPIRTNWALDLHDQPKLAYALDPSSARTREFLARRTRAIMTRYQPALLKLDFSYGLPGPDGCTPRDPQYRGERLGWTLLHTIATAARAVNPQVTILGYSLNPLWDAVQDQVALDDLGDAGWAEAEGHGHWSVWAALLGDRGRPIMASSGYDWDADTEVLLNATVLGVPGLNLPRERPDGQPLAVAALARRRALTQWCRRTAHWRPLWLDSHPGDFSEPPTLRNWGRVEDGPAGPMVTALALREGSTGAGGASDSRWLTGSGRWAVLALDERDVVHGDVAIIPFAPGTLELPRERQPATVRVVQGDMTSPWSAWSWREGLLRLTIDADACASGLWGFVVSDSV